MMVLLLLRCVPQPDELSFPGLKTFAAVTEINSGFLFTILEKLRVGQLALKAS